VVYKTAELMSEVSVASSLMYWLLRVHQFVF